MDNIADIKGNTENSDANDSGDKSAFNQKINFLSKKFKDVKKKFVDFKNNITNTDYNYEESLWYTHEFNTEILKALGFIDKEDLSKTKDGQKVVLGQRTLADGYTERYFFNDQDLEQQKGKQYYIPARYILLNDSLNQKKNAKSNKEQSNSSEVTEHKTAYESNVRLLVLETNHLLNLNEEDNKDLSSMFFARKVKSSNKSEIKDYYKNFANYREGEESFNNKLEVDSSPIDKIITKIFLSNQAPKYILVLAGNIIYLFDKDRFQDNAYLEFNLEQFFIDNDSNGNLFKNQSILLMYSFISKMSLLDTGEAGILKAIEEDGNKNATSVTKNLKHAVVEIVEKIANEVVYYLTKNSAGKQKLLDFIKNIEYQKGQSLFEKYEASIDDRRQNDSEYAKLPKEQCFNYLDIITNLVSNYGFAEKLKDDCITYVYRLLFIFFADAREELNIFPNKDVIFKKGYSLEAIRDLENVRLNEQENNGYFFDDSIEFLFNLLNKESKVGNRESIYGNTSLQITSFQVTKISSDLFDDKKLFILNNVRIRNCVWQPIIRRLSLSKYNTKGKGKNGNFSRTGRISYRNLSIIQLGSVYESLLSYRLNFTYDDSIEVQSDIKQADDESFIVPLSDKDLYKENQIKKIFSNGTGGVLVHPRGTFLFRLSSNDRQSSASYYTPDVLTRCTVKYTLKERFEKLEANLEKHYTDKKWSEFQKELDSLLDLKILEPAMGAGAFLNQIIDDIASEYMKHYLKIHVIDPSTAFHEKQRVKYIIASNNVYGIDINPTSVRLCKLSLWLNAIYDRSKTSQTDININFDSYDTDVDSATEVTETTENKKQAKNRK